MRGDLAAPLCSSAGAPRRGVARVSAGSLLLQLPPWAASVRVSAAIGLDWPVVTPRRERALNVGALAASIPSIVIGGIFPANHSLFARRRSPSSGGRGMESALEAARPFYRCGETDSSGRGSARSKQKTGSCLVCPSRARRRRWPREADFAVPKSVQGFRPFSVLRHSPASAHSIEPRVGSIETETEVRLAFAVCRRSARSLRLSSGSARSASRLSFACRQRRATGRTKRGPEMPSPTEPSIGLPEKRLPVCGSRPALSPEKNICLARYRQHADDPSRHHG